MNRYYETVTLKDLKKHYYQNELMYGTTFHAICEDNERGQFLDFASEVGKWIPNCIGVHTTGYGGDEFCFGLVFHNEE